MHSRLLTHAQTPTPFLPLHSLTRSLSTSPDCTYHLRFCARQKSRQPLSISSRHTTETLSDSQASSSTHEHAPAGLICLSQIAAPWKITFLSLIPRRELEPHITPPRLLQPASLFLSSSSRGTTTLDNLLVHVSPPYFVLPTLNHHLSSSFIQE